ncbi:MAG: nuclear transport factor 2 family protein [Cyclobacteriaceae bacterium]
MKKIIAMLTIVMAYGCQQPNKELTEAGRERELSADEIAQVKSEIIKRSEQQAQDLRNLDYRAIMTFYADIDDFIIFGDGYYWGDYQTMDGIWKDFTGGVKTMLKWDLSNPKIHVFSKDVASCLVEFYNERIEANGDTTKGHGCFSYGMQKIDGDWKVVTMHVTHNYNVFDSTGAVRKWWLKYSPENRKKAQ